MLRFDVALWRRWSSLFPDQVGYLEADNAYSAIVQLMHTYGYTQVEHAAARALDGSLVYRVYHLRGIERGPIWFYGRTLKDSTIQHVPDQG
ncbi:hypothetical protein [Dictyobacter kobayashii]|uniref:Uncharacterized protein n=1 Tax=Dictyobacter kobayashii TaxID=2014872 RepID=A0A402AD18_9CHLR|nr:hypothetical protein [Dictyobacter kobayashii]GCE17002.1 hypothetical protein KDK_08020 [Dictyobacter kobayashii]